MKHLLFTAGLVVYWFSSSMVANGRVALTKVAASAETKATVSSLCDLQKRRKNAETKYVSPFANCICVLYCE